MNGSVKLKTEITKGYMGKDKLNLTSIWNDFIRTFKYSKVITQMIIQSCNGLQCFMSSSVLEERGERGGERERRRGGGSRSTHLMFL